MSRSMPPEAAVVTSTPPTALGSLVAKAVGMLAVLTLAGLAAWPLALHSAAATRPAPKVVVIAGPVGDHNAHYQADADAIARTARKYTSNVVLIKSPRATWDRVKAALQNASIVVYLGHGNGWPSIYPPFQPYTKDGFGLDPDADALASNASRVAHRDEVISLLEDAFASWPLEALLPRLAPIAARTVSSR